MSENARQMHLFLVNLTPKKHTPHPQSFKTTPARMQRSRFPYTASKRQKTKSRALPPARWDHKCSGVYPATGVASPCYRTDAGNLLQLKARLFQLVCRLQVGGMRRQPRFFSTGVCQNSSLALFFRRECAQIEFYLLFPRPSSLRGPKIISYSGVS